MDPPLALGLFLLAGSAGAPFLIKLASAAKSDLALSAGLLVLLVPATVVFLPFYVPLAMAHPSLRGLSYVPSERRQARPAAPLDVDPARSCSVSW